MTLLGKKSGTDYVVYTFNKENNKDFSTQVDGLSAEGCDVIFLPIYYTEARDLSQRERLQADITSRYSDATDLTA